MNEFIKSITRPPYRYLPLLIWGYIALCNLIVHNSGIYTGHLAGFDDQVRMTQVLNWINGSSWYDRTILRANPPEGFTTIWSRLVDIPIAAVIIVAQQFVSQKTAALIAAAIVPMAELAILFSVAPYFARPLVGKNRSRLIILFILFTSLINVKYFSGSGFLIGEASHHPWYVILDLMLFGATARLVMGSPVLSPLLMLGGSVALLTAVGIEGYPMIAGAATIMAIIAWAYGRPIVAGRGGDALLCGAFGSFLLLPMHQPPQSLFSVSFAEPSILGVILVTSAGLFLKVEQVILARLPKSKEVTALILCLSATLIAGILINAFPRILDGPAAGLSPAERAMALSEHFEAKSIYGVSHDIGEFINLIMPIILALAIGLFSCLQTRSRRQALSLCYLAFAALGGGMSGFFSRYYHHAMTTACVWLLWGWEYIKSRLRRNVNYNLAALAAFIALGPLWMLFLPMAENDQPFGSHVLFFPAILQSVVDPCDSLSIADYIDDHYSKDTLLLVPYWQSAEFLYETDVRLDFIANYPSHDKFIDNYSFIRTHNPDIARDIARRHGVNLVAICAYPQIYHQGIPDSIQMFSGLLQVGHVPAWLKPVNTTGIETNYLLYEVDDRALNTKETP